MFVLVCLFFCFYFLVDFVSQANDPYRGRKIIFVLFLTW